MSRIKSRTQTHIVPFFKYDCRDCVIIRHQGVIVRVPVRSPRIGAKGREADEIMSAGDSYFVYLNNVPLESVSSYKYLGVHISDNLTWTLHIEYIM